MVLLQGNPHDSELSRGPCNCNIRDKPNPGPHMSSVREAIVYFSNRVF